MCVGFIALFFHGPNMGNPSQLASTLLFGTGIGCFLITGFGFLLGRISIESLETGVVFPILGLLFIALSRSIDTGHGFLSDSFPSEDDQQLIDRVRSELETTRKENLVGSAWAELEAAVLESELSEE